MPEQRQVFKYSLPQIATMLGKFKTTAVYASGALLASGFWLLMDIALYSKYAYGGKADVTIVDWIPAICSFLGMIIVSSVDRDLLTGDSLQYSGNCDAWKARLVVFLGFALHAGGMAGSVTVLVLKYVVPGFEFPTLGFGIGNVITNFLILMSSVTLWLSDHQDEDYSYNLTL